MRKCVVLILTIFLLIIFCPIDRVASETVQKPINSVLVSIIAKLKTDQEATINIEERKTRYIYDCAPYGLCGNIPKSVEKIRTIQNLDYIIEKDGQPVSPPKKMSFNMSALDANTLARYDLIEVDLLDPRIRTFNYFPRIGQQKAKSETEKVAELTIGKMTIDRHDFGITSMDSRLLKPISFGNFLFIKIFQLFYLDVTVERERRNGNFYVTTKVVVYSKFQKIFGGRKSEKHEITLIRQDQ